MNSISANHPNQNPKQTELLVQVRNALRAGHYSFKVDFVQFRYLNNCIFCQMLRESFRDG